MANASRHHIGIGAKGKGSGSGAMTDVSKSKIEENEVLSNRDKSRHPASRGLDGKQVENDQFQDQVMNRLDD